MAPEEFEHAVRLMLDEATTMTLATCIGAIPWATDVYFAADGFDLAFYSSPNSRHCHNLAGNAACAATIHRQVSSWRDIKGIQMEGHAEPVITLEGKASALAAYLRKFPFAQELFSNPIESAQAFSKAALYVFRPSRLYYLDNSLGFGTRYHANFKQGLMDGLPLRDKGGQ